MLLSFPPEIIQRICYLLLEDPSIPLDLHPSVLKNLSNLSLVHSSIRPWAQAELYRNISLYRPRNVERFVAALEGTGTEPSSCVRGLLLGMHLRILSTGGVSQELSASAFINRFAMRSLWLFAGTVDLGALVDLPCTSCYSLYTLKTLN